MTQAQEMKLTSIEAKYGVFCVTSEIDKGLVYAYDEERKGILLLEMENDTLTPLLFVKKSEVTGICKELKEVADMALW